MDRKLANNLSATTMLSMYDTVESTVQFCLQKPNVSTQYYVVEEPVRVGLSVRIVRAGSGWLYLNKKNVY